MLAPVDLEQLFESAPGYIAVVRGPDHVYQVANAAYRRLMGDRDLIGRTVREAAPELASQGYIDLLDEVFATGEPYFGRSVPVTVRTPGGGFGTVFINFVYQPIKDGTGQVTGIFAEGIDVTAGVEAESTQRDADRRLYAILGNASVSVFLIDDAKRCQYMNAAAERLTGFTLDEARGKVLHDLIHHSRPDGSNFPVGECPIDRAFPSETKVEGEELFVHKDGHFYPVAFTASPIRDESTGIVGTILELRDISAEKAAEAALNRSREQLAIEGHAFEVLSRTGAEVAAELDLDRLVQRVVDAGVELTGAKFGAFFYNVERDDGERLMLYTLSGAKISDFEHFGMPRPTQVFAPTFRGDGVIRADDITKDSRYGHNSPHSGMPRGHLPVRSFLSVPVTSRSGEVIGGLFFGHPEPGIFDPRSERVVIGLAGQAAIAMDNARLFRAAQRANQNLEQRVRERTEELQQAHEALRQAQKMEAIGQLTGGIAHDFNNLLTVILGSADILKRGGLPEEKSRRYIEAIAETADRAAKLTGQLLAFARRQALEPVVFDVVARIRSVTEMLRPLMGSRIQVEIDAECDPCHVDADPNQLETAILNMSVNARDAMSGEGRLTIRVRAVKQVPPMASEAPLEGDYVAIAIADTGSGVAPGQMERIFEPFFTTKDVGQGTGLGLSQVFGFVKQSGGEVRVESEAGEGSTFTIYLPKVAAAEAGAALAEQVSGAHVPGRGRILVVEDNDQVGAFASTLLQDLGYETLFAADAESALDLLQGQSEPIDLVFTDVVMPGMSGVELAQKIRQLRPTLPVVLTSGYSHVLVEEGAHGFPLLHKPYSVDSLSKALGEHLRTART